MGKNIEAIKLLNSKVPLWIKIILPIFCSILITVFTLGGQFRYAKDNINKVPLIECRVKTLEDKNISSEYNVKRIDKLEEIKADTRLQKLETTCEYIIKNQDSQTKTLERIERKLDR